MSTLAPGPALTPSQRNATIGAAILLAALVGLGLSLTLPLLALEMERMGVPGWINGGNAAIAGLAALITLPFVPRLAARFGLGRLLALSILGTALAFVGFKLFFDVRAWFAVRFLFSAALGTLFVLSEYWIASSAPPARRGLVMGLYATVLGLGFATGPALLGIVGSSGWPPYLTGAALFLLAGAPLAFARGLLPALHAAPSRPVVSYMLALPMATAAGAAFGAVETGGFALLPVYGLRNGLDDSAAALLISAVALGNVALQIPIGLVADRVDKARLLLLLSLCGIGGALLIPAAQQAGPLPLHLLLFAWGGLVGSLYTVGLAHLASRFEGEDLAGANAAFVMLYTVGLTCGPPVIGIAVDLSLRWGLPLAVAGFLLLLPLTALLHRR